MRGKRIIDADLFRPRGQIKREIEIAHSAPAEVICLLGPRLSDERRRRIDSVVAGRTRTLAVALEGVHDSHNAAAVIRSADAFGVQDVHVIEGARRFRSSRKVTQGAHKWVDIRIWRSAEPFVAQMREQNRQVLVADMGGEIDVRELDTALPVVLVFGNETSGLSSRLRDLADGAFHIPMVGFVESLNVSVATAVALATVRADRRGDLGPQEAEVLRARYYLRAVRAGYDIVMHERQREGTDRHTGNDHIKQKNG